MAGHILAQCLRNFGEWWFTAWTQHRYSKLTTAGYFGVELGFVVGCTIVAVVRSVVFGVFTTRASTQLHNGMLASVLAAPVHFFESVPLGRIVNRFTKGR